MTEAGAANGIDYIPRDGTRAMKIWQCMNCGYMYDEAEGDPGEGLAPGTKWEDIPEDWVCPMCGKAKSDFEMVEI